ncbi:MFS transporter [Labrys monachus]|uniref:MFS family permease n=1 Tax=Labrys monachus TaxID=217067 RepID=A0ABU0FE17_9HYPH|nr:MFS transporter [Labrys monachus]MDQ0392854.1 MFS family permease [Labrys monachus]
MGTGGGFAGRLGGIGEAFADRNFRIYAVGSVLSWLSFFVQAVAVSWTAWELTHSTTWLAVVALLDIAPNLVFIPLGGVLADRFDRYTLMMVSYVAALLQALALAVLAYGGLLTIEALALLCALHGLIHSFSIPATYGLLPRFVAREKLPSAIAVAAAFTQFAVFAGPALAGWIILHFGAAAAYATNVVGYAVFLISASFLRTPVGHVAPAASGRSILGDAVDGVLHVVRHKGIAAVLGLILVGDAITAALYQLLPAFADKVLGAGVAGMSTLMSAAGLGATLAALRIAHGGAARTTAPAILQAFLASSVVVMALMLTESLAVAAAIMALYGLAGETWRTGTLALLQMSVGDVQRGRVMSTQFLLRRVAAGSGTLAIGWLADRYGLRLPMLGAAAVAVLAWGAAYLNRTRMAAAFATPAP